MTKPPPRHPAAARAHRRRAQTVVEMAAAGLPVAWIAAHCGLPVRDLHERYGTELQRGVALAKTEIRRALFEKACAGDVPAMKFFLTTVAGWTTQAVAEPEQAIKVIYDDSHEMTAPTEA